MKLKKESIGNFIRAVCFLLVLLVSFTGLTYLMRNTGGAQRGNILGYYEEEEDSLDVVFVGASNVMRYWDPLHAWEEYGFTSHNYSVTSMRADTYLYSLKDALRTQSPEVVVVEARMFTRDLSAKTGTVSVGARNFFDSLDVGWFRNEAIRYYCDALDVSWEDALALYIDLIHYHDNYKALINPENWALADNRLEKGAEPSGFYKGCSVSNGLHYYKDPSKKLVDECEEIDEIAMKLYVDIIEYCQSNDIPLMFVATPIISNSQVYGRFNTLAQVAESYGVDFVDTNKLYEEMGLDFEQDFLDSYHVNVLGVDKFTNYFAAYLDEMYNLPDHREEEAYASWYAAYEDYIEYSDSRRNDVYEKIAVNESGFEVAEQMLATSDAEEWLSLGDHSTITLLLLANEPYERELLSESKLALRAVGATDKFISGSEGFASVYNNDVSYSGSVKKKKTGKIGSDDIKYTLSVGTEPQLQVGSTNYYTDGVDGILAVAFNNYTNRVFDVVCISVAEDGTLMMERK